MASMCTYHPGRKAVFQYNGKPYCEKCKEGYQAAATAVNRHVEPKDCFVVFTGQDHWRPIGGTGCAHWVGHQKDLQLLSGSNVCLKGYRYRVSDLLFYVQGAGKRVSELTDVQVGDIWFAGNQGHTGIVCAIKPPADPKKPNLRQQIIIRHDSSGQGKVAENDLQWMISDGGHGPSEGLFYRLS